MRISFEWLTELAGMSDLTPRQAADTLTMAGFNVDAIEMVDLSAFLVGRILSQEEHPKSRNPLWVHIVDLGPLGQRTIIAGAPNAVPGSLVPVALPGTVDATGKTVGEKQIAGFPSQGMLCAADELGLGEDHSGILILDHGQPGQPLSDVIVTQAVLEVDVTPNRPDCLCHLGLARELAAASGSSLNRPFMPAFTGGVQPPGTDLVKVAIEDPDLCRRYIGAVIRNVKVAESPDWLRRRLQAAGVRPINNVVDVTNYVLLEYGQPLHAFDLKKLAGPEIRVRLARPGEQLACLDGETRSLDARMLVIADAERPVAIAGVIGGQDSAVGEDTTEILLEAATFNGVSVRATSRALRVRTEASARFEKGISPELALAGARRAAVLLQEVAGAEVHVGWPDVYPRPQEPVRVRVLPEQVDRVLGAHVPLEEMESILRRLEFQVRIDEAGAWDVMPPVYRVDVSLPEDVAEEVGRIYGYDKVPPTLPGRRHPTWRPAEPSLGRRLDAARHVLAGAGYTEAVTPSLLARELLDRLGLADAALTLANPVSEDQDTLRTSLLPSLLQVAALNRNRGRPAVGLFETARVYLRRADAPDGQPDEPERLGLLSTGHETSEAGRAAFLHLKAALDRALRALGCDEPDFPRGEGDLFHPGRCAEVVVAGRVAGHAGELHPNVARLFDVEGRAVACEIDLAPVLAAARVRKVAPLPRFPAVDRDLGVVVAEAVEAAALQATIEEAGGELLESARAFDEYRGGQVPEGRKSVAFALTFRSAERTLTDAEVDERMKAIRESLRARHDAGFRT